MARTTGSHADVTGPRVRAEALRLFAQHGYAAVSMRQIAAAVGVQVGALYNYTPDKQNLLFTLMRDHLETALQAIADDPPQGTASQRLEAFTRFHIRFHHTRQDEVFLAYMELRNLSPENFTKIEVLRNRYEGVLDQILADGAADGTFRSNDLKLTGFAILAMLTGVNTWFRDSGRLALQDVEAAYSQMALQLVQAEAPDR